MATLGSTTAPSTSQEAFGLNVQNQHAIKLTMPAGGPWLITHVAVFVGGYNSTTGFRTCVWSSGGTVRANSSLQNLTDYGAITLGDGRWENHAMATPYEAYGGQVVYIGYARSSGGASQHPLTGSGSHVDHDNSTIPGNIDVGDTHGGTLGAYLTYEAANEVPTAPTLTAPANGSRQTDLTPTLDWTHNDPDGDAQVQRQIQVNTNSSFTGTSMWDSTASTSASSVGYGGTALNRGTTYYWRVRTADAGGFGPYSSVRSFKINALPTVTPTAPADNGFAVIHNLAEAAAWTLGGNHAKPQFKWTFSDADGDAQTAYQVRVYLAGGALQHDSTEVVSSSKQYDATWAGIMGTEYEWEVRVRDAYSEWSSYSAKRQFKMRWGQTIYEWNPGASSASWKFTPGAVTGGVAAFLYRSAVSAGGGTPGPWKTSLSEVATLAYLDVMVRLAPSAPGTNVQLTSIQFDYIGASLQPERFTMEPTAEWQVDPDTRRFGSLSLRCRKGAPTTDRYVWQAVTCTPNTEYTLSAYVRTAAPVTNPVFLRVTDPDVPDTELADLYVDHEELVTELDTTSDTSTQPDGWQRLTRHFHTGDQTTIGVGVFWLGGGTLEQINVDAMQLEESLIPTVWTPGLIGAATVIDAAGVQIDAAGGGAFSLRGSAGQPSDVVTLGAHGLVFNDAEVYSPGAGLIEVPRLRIGASNDAALGSTLHGLQIGATAVENIAIDGNEILARDNGAASTLFLNIDGDTAITRPRIEGVVSITNFDSNVGDYNPTGWSEAHILVVSGLTAARTMTGLAAKANGCFVFIHNNDDNMTLTLAHDNGSSSAATNRFYCPGPANYVIRPRGSVWLMYWNTRWRVIAA